MHAALDPRISEFATREEADAYDVWFRAKVQAALNDPRPALPHDEVVARARARLERKMTAWKIQDEAD
ncbi:hypothetical protein [Conchiformibius kuhniae]|uniref:Stability determinant domain-containing protein n=1 Tax=Conchiformibius kuhniae TaxID=211502 RepID=A0A8T9MRC9_9NEIS|nr:hypothetical protein [Conchiformibius kuhniae]UOP04127.1 hypothetical protein LVJ77_06575 [Conchiformibius kuhniae]